MARCRICEGSTAPLAIGAARFDRCTECGYAFLVDPPSASDYWPEDAAATSDFWTEAKARYFRTALAMLGRATPGRRLVDVGGGVGYFARIALDDGWDASSMDVSELATAVAAERIGDHRVLRSLDEVAPRSIDVATLWCVVAHVEDPVGLLEAVGRVIRPGGVVWLTTPNFTFQRSYARLRLLAHRPIDFAADDHRGQFTPRATARLLARAGFGRPRWSYCGITEFCATTRSSASAALSVKRAWNRCAHEAGRLGLPLVVSELQTVSRRAP
jgi:SAM-dependent methyltransferase